MLEIKTPKEKTLHLFKVNLIFIYIAVLNILS